MTSTPTRRALVLGATGGIGGETAAALLRHGWEVIALARDPDAARAKAPAALATVYWVRGDAMNADEVAGAAAGASVVVHAVNPPGYRNWGALVIPMIENTIAAARANGARIVLPGTIYNYGPDAFPDLTEDSPQHAATEKGRIRVALEGKLEEATRQGARALIVRFGDFFGPVPGSSWFNQGFVAPGKPLKAITNPATPGVGHSWAYLPDAAETIARLLDREGELEPFARFHFAGHWDADGSAMIAAIKRAVGRPDIKVKALSWPVLWIAGLLQETPREIYAMRYLWRQSIRLDGTRLDAFLEGEPHTPLDEAVRTTLAALRVS